MPDSGDSHSAASTESDSDHVNRKVWTADAATFVGSDTWSDRGERNALHLIADQVRGRPILDIGVGAGRTTWTLRLLTDRYVAVDYTQALVDLARRAHPEADIRLADARDLRQFDNDSFTLVVFSWNGLDALDHESRRLALKEFHRVLETGGILLFSTFDINGFRYQDSPWKQRGPGRRTTPKSVAKFLLYFPHNIRRYSDGYRNWLHTRTMAEHHGGWGLSTFAPHNFRLLVHFISAGEQQSELDTIGFDTVALISNTGDQLEKAGSDRSHEFFHVVARKR